MSDPMMPGDIVTDEMIERLHEERGALLIAIADQRTRAETAEKRLAAIANRAANVHFDEDDPLVVIQDIAAIARGETP